jgi:hypothetical protein
MGPHSWDVQIENNCKLALKNEFILNLRTITNVYKGKMIKDRLNEAENIMKGPILGLPESPTRNEILRDIEQSKANLMKKVDDIPDT